MSQSCQHSSAPGLDHTGAINVMLFGDVMTGKTALVERMVRGPNRAAILKINLNRCIALTVDDWRQVYGIYDPLYHPTPMTCYAHKAAAESGRRVLLKIHDTSGAAGNLHAQPAHAWQAPCRCSPSGRRSCRHAM